MTPLAPAIPALGIFSAALALVLAASAGEVLTRALLAVAVP